MSSETGAARKPADDISLRLKRILLEVLRLDIPAETINDQTNLYDLGLESLNVVELLTDAESEFDIIVDVEDLSEELFAHFGNLRRYIQEKVNESA